VVLRGKERDGTERKGMEWNGKGKERVINGYANGPD
jgi:hypothetical protein